MSPAGDPAAGNDAPPPYRTIAEGLRHEPPKTKGSRHIATIAPVATTAAAEAVVARVRDEMPDATHHAFAWRLRAGDGPSGLSFRSSDDGEPSGSAGRPILAQIDGRELTDVVVVVTRYFGGTKLGVGGLVRAYGGAAAEALDLAEIVEVVPEVTLRVQHAYGDSGVIAGVLNRFGLQPDGQEFTDEVVLRVTVEMVRRAELERALRDATAARARIETA